MTVERANSKAMALAKADPAFVHLPLRDWATAIGCSEGQVPKLPLWQDTMKQTGRGKKKGPSAPKVVSLTDSLEAVTGEGGRDEVLNQLTAEQQADFEPSPLDEDPPDRPRKVRTRKRL
jgi:hypothetical protein